MKAKSKLKKWKVTASEYVINTKWVKVRRDSVALPDGAAIDEYFVTEYPDLVIVFAVTDDGFVLLERQYKHGANNIELCLPAGMYNKSKETAKAAAQRELLEETGYVAKNIKHIGTIIEYPTKNSHKVEVFLAQNIKYKGIDFKETMEDIEVIKVPLKKVAALVKSNEIRAGSSISAIYLAMLNLK